MIECWRKKTQQCCIQFVYWNQKTAQLETSKITTLQSQPWCALHQSTITMTIIQIVTYFNFSQVFKEKKPSRYRKRETKRRLQDEVMYVHGAKCKSHKFTNKKKENSECKQILWYRRRGGIILKKKKMPMLLWP